MLDKVLLRVLLPATQRTYELRVSWDLDAGHVARLASTLLAAAERDRFVPSARPALMLLEGSDAGRLLADDAVMRDFVADATLTDGSTVALV